MNSPAIEFAGCTIIAKNYLPMARVLAESWNKFHPDAPFFVLLLDSPEGFFCPDNEEFRTIQISELAIPNLHGFLFKYAILEASTAAKPYLLRYLFAAYSIEKLLYLDPDIQLMGPLDDLSAALDESNILLTPHLTAPMPLDGVRPTDHDILQAGTYNLGFLGLREGEASRSLLDWWCDKVYHECLVAFEKNLFVDQRWMDLVPGMFNGVRIWREPGYNIAYWNLHERQVSTRSEIVTVNGRPAYFFHYSGFNPDEPRKISKHQTRFKKMSDIGDARHLYARYRQLLIKKGWNEAKKWKYDYNFFENGVPIPSAARRYYWSLGPAVEHLGNPFLWLNEVSDATAGDRPMPRSVSEPPFGVNVLGYLNSEKGVGEMGRSNLRILRADGIPHVANLIVDVGSHNLEALPASFSNGNPYAINLVAVNADQLTHVAVSRSQYFKDRFTIGYWAWELSEFPNEWRPAFEHVNEVWTLSEFARDSIAASSPVPVRTVHCSLDLEYEPRDIYVRDAFGIPEDTFVFLFYFDFHSFIERKNPVGLIDAFRNAFGSRKDVQLLIKSSHSREHLDQLQLLQRAAGEANLRVLDEVLSKDAKHGLMMAADCYVSLHRSEGFGLTIAEAMLCGKPTIATDYSGNRDFMTSETNYQVPYSLIGIDRDHGPYRIGQKWAQPDLGYASDVMRHIEQNREEAAALGRRAKAHVSQVLSPATIGTKVRDRLEELGFLESAVAEEYPRTSN
ncbi:MAG TPA: glycosyltransferase family 4 protein [Terriglobales bacterium]